VITVRTEAFPIPAFSRSLFKKKKKKKKNAAVHRHGRGGPLRWWQRPRDALPTPCASWGPSMPRCARQLKQNSCSGAPRLAARTKRKAEDAWSCARRRRRRSCSSRSAIRRPDAGSCHRGRELVARPKTAGDPAASAVLRALCAVRRLHLLFSTSTPKSDRRGEARCTTRSSPRA